MKKEVIVISLGGSLIFPNDIDTNFLKEFKKTILKNTKKYKFIIVCGGGSLARKYIKSLEKIKTNTTMQNLVGISATRNNARFMNYFFEKEPKAGIPIKMSEIKRYLKKENIVFCGGLSYKKRQTSDSTCAEIAKTFKTEFVNLTNVTGLYTKDPKKYKDAKFVEEISWKNFYKLTNKIRFHPGQHFVLDQTASFEIMRNKIKTYILGKDMKNFDNFLKGKKFKGTVIFG